MNSLIQCKTTTLPLFIAGVLACFGLLPKALAVVPPPDGGYPNFNTAEGQSALFSLTTGQWNTGLGGFTLWKNTDGSFNTAVGTAALLFNVGDQSTGEGIANTAVGAAALLFNTTGSDNTAVGVNALSNNASSLYNTAIGASALALGTHGIHNTAAGYGALTKNNGSMNTAVGSYALNDNLDGAGNTALGRGAMEIYTGGNWNTAVGGSALTGSLGGNNIGTDNTAVGYSALLDTTGSANTALGRDAGRLAATGNGNVYIGAGMTGVQGESDTTYVRNVYSSVASARAVYVDSNNKIGTLSSSRRYKANIRPMNEASEAIYALKPVSFRYKVEIEPTRPRSFGLIAEDVQKISPDLVTLDADGNVGSVRYDAVNAMLLNEFLKEHREVAELKSTIAEQRKGMEAMAAQLKEQAAQIQNVSAQLEASKPAPQVAGNNR
jgi:trimeric autotransporter adhesin